MAGSTPLVARWMNDLATSSDDITQRPLAWRQLREQLGEACRQAVRAGETDFLDGLWKDANDPRVLPFLEFFLRDEKECVGLAVDVGRVYRALLGMVAAAQAARAALWLEPDGVVRWLHETADAWGESVPHGGAGPAGQQRVGLAQPLSFCTTPPGVAQQLRQALRAGTATPRPDDLEPERILDEHFLALARLPAGWRVAAARDCARALLDRPRQVERRRRVPVLGCRADTGLVAWLHVELLANGNGECFADPMTMGLLPLTDSFLAAARNAWVACRQACREDEKARQALAECDVRWVVTGTSLAALDGGSMGATLAVALMQLLLDEPADPSCAITAAIDDNGTMGPVEDVERKASSAFAFRSSSGESIERVLVHSGNRNDAERAARSSDRPRAEVVVAETLAEARQKSSGLLTAVRAYLKEAADWPKSPRPPDLRRCMGELYVVPDVLPLGPRPEQRRGRVPEVRPPGAARLEAELSDLGVAVLSGEGEHDTGPRTRWKEVLSALGSASQARVVVLAPPGLGKSTLARMAAHTLAAAALHQLSQPEFRIDTLPLPVVVPLRTLLACGQKGEHGPDERLKAALEKALVQGGCPEGPARFLARHADEERTWLFLDALDEIEGGNDLGELLAPLQSWSCRVVINSRPYRYRRQRLPFPVAEYGLAPLSDEQVEEFICRPFRAEDEQARLLECLRASPSLRDLGHNPYLLTLLCWVAERHDLDDTLTRAQLYERMLHDLLEPPSDQPQEPLHETRAEDWLAVLGELALEEFRAHAGKRPLAHHRLASFLNDNPGQLRVGPRTRRLGSLSISPRGEMLVEALVRKRLLVRLGGDRSEYTFPHHSVLEYLAAAGLAEALRRAPPGTQGEAAGRLGAEEAWALLDRCAWDRDWEEVFLFLAGQLANPRRLLELLADQGRDDFLRHRLSLAVRCLAEVPAEVRDKHLADLADHITTELFALWWQHLLQETVAAVPHLTAALPAVGKINGRLVPVSPLRRLLLGWSRSGRLRHLPRCLAQRRPLADWLVGLLEGADEQVRRAAADALGRLGTVVPAARLNRLVGLLEDQGARERRWAAEVLGLLGAAAGRAPGFLEKMLELLQVSDPEVQRAAMEVIGRLGPEAATEAIIKRLGQLLVATDRSLQAAAAEALGRLGAVVPLSNLAKLRPLLQEQGPAVRKWAVEAIGRWGTAAGKAPGLLEEMLHALEDADPEVQGAAVEVIGRLGPEAATVPVLQALEKVLDGERVVRLEVTRALGKLGSAAAPLLARLVEDQDWDVQQAAAKARSRLAPPDFKKLERRLWEHPDPEELCRVLWMIDPSGPVPPLVLGELARLVKHEHREVRRAAVEAVGRLGPGGVTGALLEELARLLDADDVQVCREVVAVVGSLGGRAATPAILAGLGRLARAANSELRREVVAVLGSLGPEAEATLVPVLGWLAKRLAEQDREVRREAAEALGALLGQTPLRIFRRGWWGGAVRRGWPGSR